MPYIESVKTAVTTYTNGYSIFTVTHTRKASGSVESWLFLSGHAPIKERAGGHGYNKHAHNDYSLALNALQKHQTGNPYHRLNPDIHDLFTAHHQAGGGTELDSTARKLGWTVF